MKKQYHIISCGISLLTNHKKLLKENFSISLEKDSDKEDDKIFESKKQDIVKLLSEELKKDKNCAEISTIDSFISKFKINPETITCYLYGTNTIKSKIAREAIEKYLESIGIKVEKGTEVYAEEEDLRQGINKLIQYLIRISKNKIKEGYEVYVNPTRGMKAHVIATSFVASFLDVQMYYMHETFKKIVILPRMIYFPTEKEINLLKKINEKRVISMKPECDKIINEYKEEFEKLVDYGYITYE
jgi:putative CRISPR-associated protein (TIGR02619 family)